MAARPAAAFTRYEDGTCRLIGDPDLYGLGVRLGYYLSFFAGVLALAANVNKGIENSLKAINAIFAAILIALVHNTTVGSLVVLEW